METEIDQVEKIVKRNRSIKIGLPVLLGALLVLGLFTRYDSNQPADSSTASVPTSSADENSSATGLDSLAAADLAISIDPLNAEAWYTRGVFLQTEVGDLGGAVESYDRVLEINPEDLSALFNRGLAYKGLNRLNKAKADFELILSLKDGAAPYALLNLGYIAIDQGDQKLGEDYLQRAYGLDPTLQP
jgi:tetratricopeptide (TPR) repeat protein